MTLSEKIRHHRIQKGLSLNKLAILSGVSKSYLLQLENGKNKQPSGTILLKIASCIDTTITELLDKSDSQEVYISDALQELIDTKKDVLDIRQEDVQMLSKICYRGQYPDTFGYEYILRTIRYVIGE